MTTLRSIPNFHLYGESQRSEDFDFVHVELLSRRSARFGWVIDPHAHRHLHQVTAVTSGAGEALIDGEAVHFSAPAVVLTQAGVVHGFRFKPPCDGHVLNFTEDVPAGVPDAYGTPADRLARLWSRPVLQLTPGPAFDRLIALLEALTEEEALARPDTRTAQRALLVLLAVELSRASAQEERFAAVPLRRADATVAELRGLIEADFRTSRRLADYGAKLGMTADRLNEHCKRATGVTAGHLLRQRVLTEAKRQLLFTDLSASEIAYALGFADPTHLSRFFRRYTGLTPSAFRSGRATGAATGETDVEP